MRNDQKVLQRGWWKSKLCHRKVVRGQKSTTEWIHKRILWVRFQSFQLSPKDNASSLLFTSRWLCPLPENQNNSMDHRFHAQEEIHHPIQKQNANDYITTLKTVLGAWTKPKPLHSFKKVNKIKGLLIFLLVLHWIELQQNIFLQINFEDCF